MLKRPLQSNCSFLTFSLVVTVTIHKAIVKAYTKFDCLCESFQENLKIILRYIGKFQDSKMGSMDLFLFQSQYLRFYHSYLHTRTNLEYMPTVFSKIFYFFYMFWDHLSLKCLWIDQWLVSIWIYSSLTYNSILNE